MLEGSRFLLHCEGISWGSKVLAAPTIRGGHVYYEGAADKIQSGGDSDAVWVRVNELGGERLRTASITASRES